MVPFTAWAVSDTAAPGAHAGVVADVVAVVGGEVGIFAAVAVDADTIDVSLVSMTFSFFFSFSLFFDCTGWTSSLEA